MKKIKTESFNKGIGKKRLDDDERAKASGNFISLPCGNTHYEMAGSGEIVVLVHGYATPYYIYDRVFESLVSAGYRVIRYDLLGRGLSERVKKVYTAELFANQLFELTKSLIGEEKFYLAGTSMGGIIVTTYAAKYPEKVKKLFLLAPAGMPFKPPFYMKLSNIRVVGDLIFSAIGAKVLLKKCASELIYNNDKYKDYYNEQFAYALQYKGFSRATLSSLRHTILNFPASVSAYKTLAKTGIEVVALWGTEDKTMPYFLSESLKKYVPCTKLYTFEGSGHIFVFDEGEKTAEIILKEIRK